MKKILLSAMAFVAAMSANAQVFQMDGEAQGLTSELSDVEAGKAWGSIDGALDISNAFATQHKVVDCKNDDYNKVIIDGNEILTKGGVQGNDNPKDADGTGVGASLKEPVSGAVIALTAQKDGWVYIISKLSTNKQYVVFEEGAPIGYKIAMENIDARVKDGVINIEFKGEGEYNNISMEMEEYQNGMPWVIRKYLNDPEAESAGNGLGVFYFPVAAGCNYYASASGSKISWCGIYFSENEAEKIELAGATEDGTAISKVIVSGEGSSEPVEPAGNTVLWDTETAFDSWSATIVIEAEKFANVKAGDIIRVSYKDKGGDFNPIYKHVDDWSDWTDFQDAINKDNEGYFEAPVTEGAIAELQSKGLRFQGVGFTLTKVELISDASAINSVKAAKKFEGAIFNVAGQKVNASYKGLVIKDGKKYIQK